MGIINHPVRNFNIWCIFFWFSSDFILLLSARVCNGIFAMLFSTIQMQIWYDSYLYILIGYFNGRSQLSLWTDRFLPKTFRYAHFFILSNANNYFVQKWAIIHLYCKLLFHIGSVFPVLCRRRSCVILHTALRSAASYMWPLTTCVQGYYLDIRISCGSVVILNIVAGILCPL